MILGASGFLGNALYKELLPYFDVYGTYSSNINFQNKKNFFFWNLESEPVNPILENLKPDLIISAIRGNFNAQIEAHFEIIDYIKRHNAKLVFLSSANVFDAFTHYPSYEYEKTLSDSVYGRFKIKIENALLRLPSEQYIIARLPMIFGTNSPRLREIQALAKQCESIEVFPNVVINATSYQKLTQQIHYLINQNKNGIYHLGSNDLVHHQELIQDICTQMNIENPIFKRVYSSNLDRFLAVLPREKLLPKNLQVNIQEVVSDCMVNP